jgi:hypothetical protein
LNEEFDWLEYRVDATSGKGGFYCTLCRKYDVHAHNNSGRWINEPCLHLRKDKVVRHCKSEAHLTAVEKEHLAVSAATDGGIEQAFEKIFEIQRCALTGNPQMLSINHHLALATSQAADSTLLDFRRF